MPAKTVRRLELIAERDRERVVLRSPAVGFFTESAATGELLAAGQAAGVLGVLGVAHNLVVPEGVAGRVSNPRPDRVHAPVSFGDVLYELSALDGLESALGGPDGDAESAGAVLRAPFAGRFWQRPSPDADAFAQVGDAVSPGTVVGLLEVMKTFTQVTYGTGGGLPERARIARFLADDGDEVDEGAPLLEVEPA